MLEEIEDRLAAYQSTVMCASLASLICLAVLVLGDWGLAHLAKSASTPVGRVAIASLVKWGFAAELIVCFFLFVGLVRYGWQRDMWRLFGDAQPRQ